MKPTNISQKAHRPSRSDSGTAAEGGHPVVERREEREDHAADQHVVEVGDDEVGVVGLPVERHHRHHHAGQPAQREDHQEAETNSEGVVKRRRPDAKVAIQANTWMPLGIATAMLAAEKKLSDSAGMPVVNMWWTHSPN